MPMNELYFSLAVNRFDLLDASKSKAVYRHSTEDALKVNNRITVSAWIEERSNAKNKNYKSISSIQS
jgi:hypothetical protein